MHRFNLIFVPFFLTAVAEPALAQSSVAEPLDISDGGQAYLDTVGRRVDTDVVYFDPTRPAPEFATSQSLPKRPEGGTSLGVPDHTFTVIAALVLLAILYQVWRVGGPMSVSLRARQRDAARTIRPDTTAEQTADRAPAALAQILAMPDKRDALVELARSALSHVAGQNDIRWQTSWTARDLMRRLPRDTADTLRPLVYTAERVQFGHRDVSDADFRNFVEGITPLFRKPSP